MTQLMELLYKYTREYGIYKQLNHQEHADAEAMEERNLNSLKESLNVRQLAVLERFGFRSGKRTVLTYLCSSISFARSSPSIRPSSTSAAFRFCAPSRWMFRTSSRVEINC